MKYITILFFSLYQFTIGFSQKSSIANVCACGHSLPSTNVCMTDDCPPLSTTSEYYFDGCMTQDVLKKYLARAGFYNDPMGCVPLQITGNSCDIDPVTNCFLSREGCDINETQACIDEDIIFFKKIGIKYLRTFGSWGGSEYDWFGEEKLFAKKIHCEVDPEIIIEGAVQEFVSQGLTNKNIRIPNYVLNAFDYTGSSLTFQTSEIVYDGLAEGSPDISKIVAKMWYYYVATQFILHGYESIHMGVWTDIVKNDPGNINLWDVLCKIRSFAKDHARRKYVLINGGGYRDKLPYTYSNNEKILLFDFIVLTPILEETYCVENPNNKFFKNTTDKRYDRLVKVKEDFSIYQYGGISAQPNCMGECYKIDVLPFILHFDIGGNIDNPVEDALLEGTCTSTENNPSESYLTWGWGGELNYFNFLTDPIKRYLIADLVQKIQQYGNGNGFFMMPIKGPLASFHLDNTCGGNNFFLKYSNCEDCQQCHQPEAEWCKSERYICSNIENPIGKIWLEKEKYNVTFCNTQSIHSDFSADDGWASDNYPRQFLDVNNDGLLDILGFGHSHILVSLNQNNSFQSPVQSWGTSLTFLDGYNNQTFRSTGDFNGDGNDDIIGINNNKFCIGLSNGVNSFNFIPCNFNAPIGGKWYIVNTDNNIQSDEICHVVYDNQSVTVSLFSLFGQNIILNSVSTYNIPNTIDVFFMKLNGDNAIDFVVFTDPSTINTSNVFGGAIQNKVLPTLLNNYESTINVDCMESESTDCCGNFESPNCSNQWDNLKYKILAGDIDGDYDDDMIIFGEEGIRVSKNQHPANKFSEPEYWIYELGAKNRSGGWNNNEHIRTLGDVNGDNMSDVIGFGEHKLYILLSGGDFFFPPSSYNNFADEPDGGGWEIGRHIRMVVDFDNDGRDEIVGFGEFSVLSINCENGSFFKNSNTTDEKHEETNKISIYPNPANNKVTVKSDALDLSISEVQIFNSSNTPILNNYKINDIRTNEINIDFGENLTNGIYFIKILHEKEFLVYKLLIIK